MRYEFEDLKTGEIVERDMSMHDAIPIGKVVRWRGRKLRRILSQEMQVAVERDVNFSAVSQAPVFDKGEQERSGHPHWNNDPSHYGYGCPVFTSKREIAAYLKRNGGVYGEDGMSKVKA